jgi:hypothetical protein
VLVLEARDRVGRSTATALPHVKSGRLRAIPTALRPPAAATSSSAIRSCVKVQ